VPGGLAGPAAAPHLGWPRRSSQISSSASGGMSRIKWSHRVAHQAEPGRDRRDVPSLT
jgi:hypothetical protein